jgi:proline iminopeptidase
MIFLGPVPPRQGEFEARYGKTLEGRLTAEQRAEMARLEDAMLHGRDPVAACRAYWAIGVVPRVDRPELASRVTGDFCSSGPDAIRAGMGVAGPRTSEQLGAWDFRAGLAKVAAPTLIIHGETDAIPMDLVEEWTAALPAAKLLKVPGASHFPYVERPDLVWPAIEQFLSSTPP